MTRPSSLLIGTCLLISALLIFGGIDSEAQTPDDASDGVVLVHTLPGANAGNKIFNCVQMFAHAFAESGEPAGTCDARGLPGGEIRFRVYLNVEGLKLILGNGTYTITEDGGFVLSADNVVLTGQGNGTHLDAFAKTGPTEVIKIGNLDQRIHGARLQNLKITGKRTGPGYVLVQSINTMDTKIESVTAMNTVKSAIKIMDSSDAWITRCSISNVAAYGILISGSSQRVQISNNRVARAGLDASSQNGIGGIAVLGSSDDGPAPSWVRIAENTIHQYGGAGIRVTRIQESIPREVQIVDNQIDSMATELINYTDPRETKDGEGIAISGSNIQILGNRVHAAYVNGILIWSNIDGSTIENITVAGNTISNSSQMPGTGNVHHAVELLIKQGMARNIVISNNVTFDDQTIPTQKYAVKLNPAGLQPGDVVENLFVDGNLSLGNLSPTPLDPNIEEVAITSGNVP